MSAVFFCKCGEEVHLEDTEVRDGLPVRCEHCGREGSIYVDADEEGGTYAGVSWRPLEPEGEP